jgi:pimeloyl-ACP methyl ester carboxylesterase
MMLGYKTLGSGPANVLVLHGWYGDETMLDPLVPSLSLEKFTYCSVAYRGYGASRGLSGIYSLDEIADDALDVARSLGWKEFSLVGHSMGGKVAQMILLRAPQSVQRIVAITPVPASAVPFDERSWALFSGAVHDVERRAAIIDASTGHRLTPSWINRLARHSFATSTIAAFGGYLNAWVKTDFSTAVSGSTVPMLVLVGAHDPHLNEETMRATYLKWFTHSRMEVITNAGHYPMDETPIDLATRMERFLAATD